MTKIKIDEVEIEVADGADVSVDGKKVTISPKVQLQPQVTWVNPFYYPYPVISGGISGGSYTITAGPYDGSIFGSTGSCQLEN